MCAGSKYNSYQNKYLQQMVVVERKALPEEGKMFHLLDVLALIQEVRTDLSVP